MYYAVLKEGKTIDVLDRLVYVKYQPEHKVMVVCSENDAQGIVSSDGNYIWHVDTMYQAPPEYETVSLQEIGAYDYQRLSASKCRTPEEIIDEYTMQLIQEGRL